jgi:hypothetical protein
MTREEWHNHIVEVCGLPAPPPLILPNEWNEAVTRHQAEHPECKECQARIQAIRAFKAARGSTPTVPARTQSPAVSTGRGKR